MQKLVLLTSISFGILIGVATAEPLPQPNRIQGTPGSLFPYAAPHEIKIINGIPCRTILDPDGGNRRIPIACAGRPARGSGDPYATGSIRTRTQTHSGR